MLVEEEASTHSHCRSFDSLFVPLRWGLAVSSRLVSSSSASQVQRSATKRGLMARHTRQLCLPFLSLWFYLTAAKQKSETWVFGLVPPTTRCASMRSYPMHTQVNTNQPSFQKLRWVETHINNIPGHDVSNFINNNSNLLKMTVIPGNDEAT